MSAGKAVRADGRTAEAFWRLGPSSHRGPRKGTDLSPFELGIDVKPDSPARESSSLESLIVQALPANDAEDLIHRLVLSWCETFSLSECAVIWFNPWLRRGELADLVDGQEYQRRRFADSVSSNSLRDRVRKSFSHLAEFDWHELRLDNSSSGWIGIPSTVQFSPPEDWLSVSSRLLATALNWEQKLLTQKLAALGEFAAGAGHEINNPLAAIKGRAAQLLEHETDPNRRQLLETIGAQTYRIRDMIGDTMLFATPPAPQPESLDFTVLLESVVHRFTDEFRTRKISLWGKRDRDIEVLADETQLKIVVAELVRNALAAVDDGGRIEIDCYADPDDASCVLFRITDDGKGLTAVEREHAFDPFYSGRQAGRGLGFGLSKCWRIITQHQGTIAIGESSTGVTEIVVRLPQPN